MWKRILRISLGGAFLVLGIIGFFVPILQGFLFTLIGLTLLSRESRRVRRLLYWLRGRAEVENGESAEGQRPEEASSRHPPGDGRAQSAGE